MRITLETKSLRVISQPNGNLTIEIEPVDETGWAKTLPQDALLTIKELSGRLSVSRRTIQNYFRRSVNPLPHSKAGGRPRVRESDLSVWLNTSKTKEKFVLL